MDDKLIVETPVRLDHLPPNLYANKLAPSVALHTDQLFYSLVLRFLVLTALWLVVLQLQWLRISDIFLSSSEAVNETKAKRNSH